MPYSYRNGEPMRKGDRVLFLGERGEIEFVADPLVSDPETEWYVSEYGGGVMLIEPKKYGRVFLAETYDVDDLQLVSRKEQSP
jgi:hypothetical protein